MTLDYSASKQLNFLDSITPSDFHSTVSTKSEQTGQKHTDPNVLGDIAEYYSITYLLDKGLHVYRNACCTGPVDLIAMDATGAVTLIDVKAIRRERDYNVASIRSPLQKKLGVQILDFDVATRDFSWKKHRD
jgi:Holliday junction resolvase-like predicted endonuclease